MNKEMIRFGVLIQVNRDIITSLFCEARWGELLFSSPSSDELCQLHLEVPVHYAIASSSAIVREQFPCNFGFRIVLKLLATLSTAGPCLYLCFSKV
jgi:hypothetical protein